ncbi:hypothetical protein C8R48DRAFT_768007 [Suillus tomentosus]|nr:hypothetical protein C8R48DRAFT_768007 [Suillus tomentosus]
MAIISPDLGTTKTGSDFTTKTLNTFLMATSNFLSKLLDVLNISLGFSLPWQQYVQGSIFTLPTATMSCALGSDGKLKDASTIDWYNDPDDESPMVPAPPPSTSHGKLNAFVSRCSG